MKICPKCKTENQDKEFYCITCMAPLENVQVTYTEEQKKQKQAEEYNQKKLEISEERSKAFRKILFLTLILCIVGIAGATTYFVLKHIGRQRELEAERQKEQTALKIAENNRLEAEAKNKAAKLAIEKEKAEKERLEAETKAEKERLEAESKAEKERLKAEEARRLAAEKEEAAKQLVMQKKIDEIKKMPVPQIFKSKDLKLDSTSDKNRANAVVRFYQTKGAKFNFVPDLRKHPELKYGILVNYSFPQTVTILELDYYEYRYRVLCKETFASGEERSVKFYLSDDYNAPKIEKIYVDGKYFLK